MKDTTPLLVICLIAVFLSCGCVRETGEDTEDTSPATTLEGSALTDLERRALDEAINDEYKARATYAGVLRKFGQERPFTSIRAAEETHIEALLGLYDKYGLEPPADTWPDKVGTYETLTGACDAGVTAEMENADLYDKLIAQVEKEDIKTVFRSLQAASRENHLPAFERCAGTGA